MKDTVLITEGKTLLFVPKGSQSNAPPKTPALSPYGAVAEAFGLRQMPYKWQKNHLKKTANAYSE